jgi:hypothetical protein
VVHPGGPREGTTTRRFGQAKTPRTFAKFSTTKSRGNQKTQHFVGLARCSKAEVSKLGLTGVSLNAGALGRD